MKELKTILSLLSILLVILGTKSARGERGPKVPSGPELDMLLDKLSENKEESSMLICSAVTHLVASNKERVNELTERFKNSASENIRNNTDKVKTNKQSKFFTKPKIEPLPNLAK